MYKVLIGNESHEMNEYAHNLEIETENSDRLYGMLMFAIENDKSFQVIKEPAEISLDGIEEI